MLEEKSVALTNCESANSIFELINCAEQFGNQKIDIIICNDEPWFKGKDIALILGYDNTTKSIRDNVEREDRLSLEELYNKVGTASLSIHYNKNQLKTIYINKNGLIQFLSSSKMPNKSDFIKWCKYKFNIDYEIITRLYKEQETIGQIIKVFNYKNYKTQYKVNNYRIDLYFIDDKLAIECDEFGHKDRNQEYEMNRENYIKNKLNCHFIRYNPDDTNFCIFNVIKTINLQIYK